MVSQRHSIAKFENQVNNYADTQFFLYILKFSYFEINAIGCLNTYNIFFRLIHRIIDDRMENSVNGRQIRYNLR